MVGVGGAEGVLSRLAAPPGDTGSSAGDAVMPRQGEAGVRGREGLKVNEAGPKPEWVGVVGEVCVAQRCDEEEDEEDSGVEHSDEGGPGAGRAPGDTEKVVGMRRPKRASSSVHTAKLRLPPSSPASELLASSWQRSTKLPRRTASRSAPWRTGRGLWLCIGSLLGLAKDKRGGACGGRPAHSVEEPEAPAAPRPPAE